MSKAASSSLAMASFELKVHNPDVLTCIANLSNDEVFTPPELVNQMLDSLEASWSDANGGASIWNNKEVSFLDPCTKSGVFLREIVKRLCLGLRNEIPDLTERVNHILTKQIYGIAITELTSLLARRSLYCSKSANGLHSVARVIKTEVGNVWFERTEHAWDGGNCRFCGASRAEYARSKELETHAYAFIHTENIREQVSMMFGGPMQFDVIIGNPPYQLNDGGGGGSSASPIYQFFIEQAHKLDPRHLIMVIPAKWYSGGKGLDEFRSMMLSDTRIRYIADFPDARDVFPDYGPAGGVCYFSWERDNPGKCVVDTFEKGVAVRAERKLDEFDSFIRDNRALAIIHKILESREESLSTIVSSRKPFGIESAQRSDTRGDLYLFASGQDGKIRRSIVPRGFDLIDKWKVLLSKTSSEHAGQVDKAGTKRVFSRIEVMKPGSVCTESYLVLGPFKTKTQSENVADYLKTRFVRFLVSSILLTQNISKGMFQFVPIQDFSQKWTDDALFEKYGLTETEVAFIKKSIRSHGDCDE
jgi:hypothetical protein